MIDTFYVYNFDNKTVISHYDLDVGGVTYCYKKINYSHTGFKEICEHLRLLKEDGYIILNYWLHNATQYVIILPNHDNHEESLEAYNWYKRFRSSLREYKLEKLID